MEENLYNEKENKKQEEEIQPAEIVNKSEEPKIILSRYALVSIGIIIIIISSLFGAIFGFVAGGSSKNLFADILNKTKNQEAGKINPLNIAKISDEDAVITGIVEKSSPAVVSIVISKNVSTVRDFGMPFGFDFPFDPFGADPNVNGGNQGTQKKQIGGGTGFFVSADGMIVTNKHVVSDAGADYTVVTSDEKEYPAKVLARDPVQDIAIIKIEGKDFPVLSLGDSNQLKIGQTVIAIGNSLGEFSNTVSRGIISGLKRNLTAGSELGGQTERLTNIVQTDAAINPGNSGGPLIDINGNVIGVNVAVAQGAQNVGFALPINQVQRVITQIEKTGKISTPYLGVRYLPIDATIQKENNLSYSYGVIVQRGQKLTDFAVIPGSPADKAGIVENDIILEINGEKIDDKNQLSDLIAKYAVGDTITLKIWHKGEVKEVGVKLEERK